MKSKVLHLDVETSSLDPTTGQLLQLAMVVDDLDNQKPLDELPKLNLYFNHRILKGDPFALQMNERILNILATQDAPDGRLVTAGAARWTALVHNFINAYYHASKVTVAGFNVGSFDLLWLPEEVKTMIHHRCLDLGSLFAGRLNQLRSLSSHAVMEHCGINTSEYTHNALEDCFCGVKTLRHFYNTKGT